MELTSDKSPFSDDVLLAWDNASTKWLIDDKGGKEEEPESLLLVLLLESEKIGSSCGKEAVSPCPFVATTLSY